MKLNNKHGIYSLNRSLFCKKNLKNQIQNYYYKSSSIKGIVVLYSVVNLAKEKKFI